MSTNRGAHVLARLLRLLPAITLLLQSGDALRAQDNGQVPWRIAGRVLVSTPGPIERRTPLASPEHPIPRRAYFIAPLYPPEAAALGVRAAVSVRAILDEGGFVVEARLADAPVIGAYGVVLGPGDEPSVASAFDALASMALDTVRQWRYEPPVNGPVAFDVTLLFSPESDARIETSVPRAATRDAEVQSRPLPVSSGPLPEWAEGVKRVGGTVRPPLRMKSAPPLYPADARAKGVQGRVVIDLRIEPDGHILHARVIESVEGLDEAALAAVMQWEFSPPLVDGASAPVLMTVTVQFTTR